MPSTLAGLGEHSSWETIVATRRSFEKEKHPYISVEHRLTAKLYTFLDGAAEYDGQRGKDDRDIHGIALGTSQTCETMDGDSTSVKPNDHSQRS